MMLNLLIVVVSVFWGISAQPDKIICYFGSWSVYRDSSGKFSVEDIDPFKCTHLIYAFTGILADGSIKILDPWNDINLAALRRFNDLKLINPNLKTLIAMGGWNQGSVTFSQVAGNAILRSTLANNIVNFLNQYGFDGFDFDWEYPAQRGGVPADKANFVELLRVCRAALDSTGKKYLLTAAVAATATAVDISYDVPSLANYLDFINVMTYDFHGSYDQVTGQNAPLYASPIDVTPQDKERNVKASINAWIQRGAPPEKLVLGLGVYGRTFTLATANNQLGAPAYNPGDPGPYTKESGFLGYNEICEMQQKGGWTVIWDDVQKVPYAYKGNQWVGYDNPTSIKAKVNFAKDLNLGGLMIWSIDTDDFRGTCGPKYPILTAIKEAMGNSVTTPTTTVPSNTGGLCKGEGYFRDPKDCRKFYYCSTNGDKFSFICPETTYYDESIGVCNYAYLVECNV